MRGAYGFKLAGVGDASAQLVEPGAGWPTLAIERVTGTGEAKQSVVGANRAEIELVAGDHLSLQRSPLRATFTTSEPLSDDALVHPYLAPAAAVAGYWLGRESFHAGAVALHGGVWAVVGEKESGKSSLLAALVLQGYAVLADDVLVVDGTTAFAGPRSIDLRREPAKQLGVGEPLGTIGDRERWRLRLGQVESTGRLRGWVFLAWGDSIEAVPTTAAERLQKLLRHRMVKGLPPPDPLFLLELSALPGFELRRPRQWSQLESAGSRLIETLLGR